jgi:hypothetical protein
MFMQKCISALMFLSLFNSLLQADELKLGAAAPEVVTVDHTGAPLDFGKALSEGTALVFFYPKAMTRMHQASL